MARSDYRDPARQKFGKRTVAYPWGDLNYPVITEVFDGRKGGGGENLPFLTVHPIFQANSVYSGYPGAFLTKQSNNKGDDDGTDVTQVYETLPTPFIIESLGVNSETRMLEVKKRRKNIAANIKECGFMERLAVADPWINTIRESIAPEIVKVKTACAGYDAHSLQCYEFDGQNSRLYLVHS